jgi:hypothetical protein
MSHVPCVVCHVPFVECVCWAVLLSSALCHAVSVSVSVVCVCACVCVLCWSWSLVLAVLVRRSALVLLRPAAAALGAGCWVLDAGARAGAACAACCRSAGASAEVRSAWWCWCDGWWCWWWLVGTDGLPGCRGWGAGASGNSVTPFCELTRTRSAHGPVAAQSSKCRQHAAALPGAGTLPLVLAHWGRGWGSAGAGAGCTGRGAGDWPVTGLWPVAWLCLPDLCLVLCQYSVALWPAAVVACDWVAVIAAWHVACAAG